MTATDGDVFDEWDKYVAEQKEADGYISSIGETLGKVLPSGLNPFTSQRGELKAKVFEALEALFNNKHKKNKHDILITPKNHCIRGDFSLIYFALAFSG